MTLVTTDQQLARFAVEMAARRTGWPSEVIPLEDGWLVRNAHVELTQEEVRREYDRQVEAEPWAIPCTFGDLEEQGVISLSRPGPARLRRLFPLG